MSSSLITEWTLEENTRLYHSSTPEQREAALQSLSPPLTGNFSYDFPRVCKALGYHLHPLLLQHVAAYQPPPQPTPPPSDLSPTSPPPSLAVPPTSSLPSQPPSPKPSSSPKPKPSSAKLHVKPPTPATASPPPPAAPATPPIPADPRDTLYLHSSPLDAATVTALLPALASSTFLTSLRLSHTPLDAPTAALLGAVTARGPLQRLALDYLPLSLPTPSPHPFLPLVSGACPLQVLSLQRIGLGDADGAALVAAMAGNPTLGVLNLSGNALGPLSAAALGACLAVNQVLVHVAVRGVGWGAREVAAVVGGVVRGGVEGEGKARKGAGGVGRVQGKGTRWWREANTSLRVLDLSWGAGGEGLIGEIRRVRAAGEGGEAGDVGWGPALEVLRVEGCGWTEEEWRELRGMGPLVQVEEEWASRVLHPIAEVPLQGAMGVAAVVAVGS